MPQTLGIIGCGNMGGALLAGFAQALPASAWRLLACDHNAARIAACANRATAVDAMAVAREAEIIILAVKPDQMPDLCKSIAPLLRSGQVVISIAAGLSLAWLRRNLGPQCQLARCMPTTTAMAGHGIFAFCFEKSAQALPEAIVGLFQHLGLCLTIPEAKFSAFSALVGAGPAYVFACMQALAQAGLTLGFTQAQNRAMLIELFIGAGELAKMQPKNFAQLKDDVCSPAGLTIAGVNVLDRAGLAGIFVDAVEAAWQRAKAMET